jgi:cysteine synthase A
MTKHKDILSAIGNTPLIRLNRASDATGCEISARPSSSIPASR